MRAWASSFVGAWWATCLTLLTFPCMLFSVFINQQQQLKCKHWTSVLATQPLCLLDTRRQWQKIQEMKCMVPKNSAGLNLLALNPRPRQKTAHWLKGGEGGELATLHTLVCRCSLEREWEVDGRSSLPSPDVHFSFVDRRWLVWPSPQKIHPNLRGNFWVTGEEHKFHSKMKFILGWNQSSPENQLCFGVRVPYMYCKAVGRTYMHWKWDS